LIPGGVIIKRKSGNEYKRIEERPAVMAYLDKIKYALASGQVRINFQHDRRVDQQRDIKYSNRYTVQTLFPDEDAVKALKRELATLTVEEYVETVKDTSFPNLSEMRVFGKKYSLGEVYIKIRVELLNIASAGAHTIFVMSFHFAENDFEEENFPYRKTRGE